jgi:monoamine oxidase
MFDDGVLRPCDDLWPQVDRIFDSLETRGRPDESFEEFVQSSFRGHAWRPARAWSEAYVEGFNAARKERISVRALARDERAAKAIGGDRAFRFKDGYSRLIEVLSSTIPADRIRTHNDVRTIFWRRHHVEVEASGQSYRARQAVITLPLSILQDSAAVRFIPEITDKRAAARELQMGQVTRLVMRFKEPFWRPGMSFLYSPSEVFTAWWTNLPIDGHKLTGWTAGVRPEFLNAQGPTWVVHQALGSLSRIFTLNIAELKTLLDEIHYHDWQTDPFTRGAYSYIPVGSIEVPAYLARPVDDTLFFAGEATDSAGRGGTVDGAIASGRRAAREALGAAAESGRPARL